MYAGSNGDRLAVFSAPAASPCPCPWADGGGENVCGFTFAWPEPRSRAYHPRAKDGNCEMSISASGLATRGSSGCGCGCGGKEGWLACDAAGKDEGGGRENGRRDGGERGSKACECELEADAEAEVRDGGLRESVRARARGRPDCGEGG